MPGPLSHQGVFLKGRTASGRTARLAVPLQAVLSSQVPHAICILTTRMQFHTSDSSQTYFYS